MENTETCQEKCEFIMHPYNFDVIIKEIKPIHVHASKSIVLNLQVINNCSVNSWIKIKTKPTYGDLYVLDSSTLVYKSKICFPAMDLFQIQVEDDCGGKRTESVLIQIVH